MRWEGPGSLWSGESHHWSHQGGLSRAGQCPRVRTMGQGGREWGAGGEQDTGTAAGLGGGVENPGRSRQRQDKVPEVKDEVH